MDFRIRELTPDEAHEAAPQLGAVLHDCVEGGASVSFMAGLTAERATAFWRDVAAAARADKRAIIVGSDAAGIAGVVEVIPVGIENQPHRAEIAKMLVHRRARRRGLAAGLLTAAEAVARKMGRTLLTLDTATGSEAERVYTRLGWSRVGVVPNYALWPDGRACSATFFFKRLDSGHDKLSR